MQTSTVPETTNNIDQSIKDNISKPVIDQRYVIKILASILALAAFFTALSAFWASTSGGSLMVGIAWTSGCVLFLISYFAAQSKTNSENANKTVYLQIIGLQAIIIISHLQSNPDNHILILFLVSPVLVGVLNFKSKSRYIVNFINLFLLLGLFLYDESIRLSNSKSASFDTSGFAYLLLTYMILVPIITIYVKRQTEVTQLSANQASELQKLVQSLASTTQLATTISKQLTELTVQLSSVSSQQAENDKALAVAVTQVTASLEELNETASHIAVRTANTNQLIEHAVSAATLVKETSTRATLNGLEGQQATIEAKKSVEEVRGKIELLGQSLQHLIGMTKKVNNFVELIDNVADETHLLSLNASIEAAGANDVIGERFSVIATEIRTLSQRSRASTGEVSLTIQEINEAVSAAVQVAEEIEKENMVALTRSQTVQVVIEKLNGVITDSAERADSILEVASEIEIGSEAITLATNQQHISSQQILSTMFQIEKISHAAVNLVEHLSTLASEVNQQTNGLNILLLQAEGNS
jgi:methyl-accepting chemotaxis protein